MAKRPKTTVVSLEIPALLLTKALNVLGNRGTTLDDFLRLQLRSLTRHDRFYKLADRFTFGKYKDETIEDVIRADPTYLTWCLNTVGGFAIDIEALELLQDMGVDL